MSGKKKEQFVHNIFLLFRYLFELLFYHIPGK